LVNHASSTITNLTITNSTTTNATSTNLVTTNLKITGITGSTQCLTVDTNGVVSGTGSACGAGGGSSGDPKWATSSTQTMTIYPSGALATVIGGTATTGTAYGDNAKLQVYGLAIVDNLVATNTTATSTFAGNVQVGAGTTVEGSDSKLNFGSSTSIFTIGKKLSDMSFRIASSSSDFSTRNYFVISRTGNVGISTTSPFSLFSVAGSAYIGGNLTATGTITATPLGTPAGTFIAADPNGTLIATTSPAGGTVPTVVTTFPKPVFNTNPASTGLDLTSSTTMKVGLVNVPEKITVNKLTFQVYAATTPGILKLGLYTEDGSTLVFSTTTGSISTTGVKIMTLSSPVEVTAGNYYVAVVSTLTANIGILGYAATVDNAQDDMNNIASEPVMEGAVTVTGGTLPSSITPTSITKTNNYTTVFRLDN